MSGGYGTATEHMDWAARRALEYYDKGDSTSAIASFVSDMEKHSGTAHISANPATLMILHGSLRNRHEFEKAMRGFAH